MSELSESVDRAYLINLLKVRAGEKNVEYLNCEENDTEKNFYLNGYIDALDELIVELRGERRGKWILSRCKNEGAGSKSEVTTLQIFYKEPGRGEIAKKLEEFPLEEGASDLLAEELLERGWCGYKYFPYTRLFYYLNFEPERELEQ